MHEKGIRGKKSISAKLRVTMMLACEKKGSDSRDADRRKEPLYSNHDA